MVGGIATRRERQWKFKTMPAVAKTNAATKANFMVSETDGNGYRDWRRCTTGQLPAGRSVPDRTLQHERTPRQS